MDRLDADPANWRDGELEKDAERAARILAWVEEGQHELEAITGEGEAADGQIKVVTGSDGLVRDIAITRRAMRLDSGSLAEELLAAVHRAQDDAERKGRELLNEALGEVLPAGASDVEAIEEQYARILDYFDRP
ncbi:YbaB/EbfC family nucleoid-associated protein [Sphaerisporangium sp. NPDC005288]|uniref:YbaB/EbfC family nucleoid-associated protein n=1 Tax=Sphaerisporangium rhizosphaerae TaxID=2269375 RepID=A0ABW2PAC9_9ACTN